MELVADLRVGLVALGAQPAHDRSAVGPPAPRSISSTEAPAAVALLYACRPAVPAPMIATSQVLTVMAASALRQRHAVVHGAAVELGAELGRHLVGLAPGAVDRAERAMRGEAMPRAEEGLVVDRAG